jgi:hypothetical protein
LRGKKLDLKDKIQKLLAGAALTDGEKSRLALLGNAVVKNTGAYKEDPTAANKRNLDAAEKGLGGFVGDLEGKYFPEAPATDIPPDGRGEFKNRVAALKHLQERGYKIKKSKLYKDAAAGVLRVEKDGSILRSSIERYLDHPEAGLAGHLETVAAGRDLDLKDLAREKIKAGLEKEKAQTEKIRFELERERGQWLPRDDFEMELASRAAVLDQGFKTAVQMHCEDWIHMVGGRVSAAQELKTAICDEIDRMLADYVSMKSFQVIFSAETEKI